MRNLPPEAMTAMINLLGAWRRYDRLVDARVDVAELVDVERIDLECMARLRDIEQHLITFLTAVLGDPDDEQP